MQMSVSLVGVGGDERDCGFLSGEGESLPLSPLGNLGDDTATKSRSYRYILTLRKSEMA